MSLHNETLKTIRDRRSIRRRASRAGSAISLAPGRRPRLYAFAGWLLSQTDHGVWYPSARFSCT